MTDPVQPPPHRHAESGLRALEHRRRHPRLHDFAKQALGRLRVAVARARLAAGELDDVMIEQRAARFERMRHRRAIDLDEDVVGQIVPLVPLLQVGQQLALRREQAPNDRGLRQLAPHRRAPTDRRRPSAGSRGKTVRRQTNQASGPSAIVSSRVLPRACDGSRSAATPIRRRSAPLPARQRAPAPAHRAGIRRRARRRRRRSARP